MKIELRTIEHHLSFSEKTERYCAALRVDEACIGRVSNRGTGGAVDFHDDHVAFAKADSWCRLNLPRWSSPGPDGEPGTRHETDLEMNSGALLARHVGIKQMQRDLRANLMFRKLGDGALYMVKVRAPAKTTDPAVQARLLAQYPGALILNALTNDEAWMIYSECSECRSPANSPPPTATHTTSGCAAMRTAGHRSIRRRTRRISGHGPTWPG